MGSSAGAFGKEWARVVPGFHDEPDAALRREMRWNTAVLEAMATYRDYYDETAVPQGTLYDYVWGVWCVSRDFAQHGLPLCHTNPALAKSILRFIMKRMLRDGEIKSEDMGFGWVWPGGQGSSDQQLYFFMLISEYLRATKDVSVLTEEVAYYPAERSGKGTGLDRIREAFLFLREQIGTGDHGLVCMWRGDWNDQFYAEPDVPRPDQVFWTAESHMNSAMLVSVLGDLTAALAESISKPEGVIRLPKNEISELVQLMREYRKTILEAYLRDWGTRPFPRRAYLSSDQVVGEQNMWLEPQGFTLQIAELAVERKRALWDEICSWLLAGESQGCRQREKPSKGSEPWTSPGTRENGGFWYALEGPLVLGVATFDHATARDLLKRMTFAHFAERFPEYWTGHWSASDSLDSSLVPTEGLSYVPVYCAHAHAWPLYCYLRLREAAHAS
jgi:cellobiose phosphorylase